MKTDTGFFLFVIQKGGNFVPRPLNSANSCFEIEEHLKKEKRLNPKDIKVLSLFLYTGYPTTAITTKQVSRLPVNQQDAQLFDRNINRLTVVANDAYEDFAKTMQTEIEEDCGVSFEGRIKNKE